MGYRHRITLPIPAQVSCLSFIESHQLLVGSGTAKSSPTTSSESNRIHRRWLCPPLQSRHAQSPQSDTRLGTGLLRFFPLPASRCSPLGCIWPTGEAHEHCHVPALHRAHAVLPKALQFSLRTDKLILMSSDALQTLDLGIDDDNLGEVRFSTRKFELGGLTASTSSP